MIPFSDLTHFAGLDWASEHHDVCVLDKTGATVEQFRVEDTAKGWEVLQQKLRPYPALAVAVETSTGPVVEHLLDAEYTVYPVNPLSAKEYRKRHAPSGAKDDRRDAWALADALRMDGQGWRSLKPEDPDTLELRLVCRDEQALVEERTAKVLQLQSALRDYYPAALEAFDDWTKPTAWDFIVSFPSSEELQKSGRRRWENFLHSHRLAKPVTYERRMEVFANAMGFHGSPATTNAKSLLAVSLAKILRTMEVQLKSYRARIKALYDKHPDKDWFGTLPIPAEGKTAPRLLAELGSQRERFQSAQELQSYAGTAPVTMETGKKRAVVRMRRGCNKHLRFAIHWFADLSREKCAWAQAYYEKKRAEGQSHAAAIRCLGQRWLDIIWKMWRTRTPYDPDLHTRNQIKHGSWVLSLLPSPAPQPAVP